MASGDANELEKEVKSTGNDESDRIDEVDSSEDRESGQITKDVSAKKEVSLADILENPDKFPNMINIMIAMNKFPIDGGSVAKFLGNKFKQPVTPDTADKLLASVLLDMFRKISNDLNGIVLFENGEIDDEKSLQQAMEHGIPVPPGVNKETFEDKYQAVLDIIKKDAEIFDVERFIDKFTDSSLKVSRYVDLEGELNAPDVFRYETPNGLGSYINLMNEVNKKDKAFVFKDVVSDKAIDYACSINSKEGIPDDVQDPEMKKEIMKQIDSQKNNMELRYSKMMMSGEIPGKTDEDKINNALRMIRTFGNSIIIDGKVPQTLKLSHEYEEMIKNVGKKVEELTGGEFKAGEDYYTNITGLINYQRRQAGEEEHEPMTEDEINNYTAEVMKNAPDRELDGVLAYYMQLEASKEGRLNPRTIVELQRQLLEKYDGLGEILEGLYENDDSGKLSKMGQKCLQRVKDGIVNDSLEADINYLEKIMSDGSKELTPEMKKYYGKILLLKINNERQHTRDNLGTALTEDVIDQSRHNLVKCRELLFEMFRNDPSMEKYAGKSYNAPHLIDYFRIIYENPEMVSHDIRYGKIQGELEKDYIRNYYHGVLLDSAEQLLSQEKIRDNDVDRLVKMNSERINSGQVTRGDALAALTADSKIDFEGLGDTFRKVYRTKYVRAWVTPENVVKLRYLELKLKLSQLRYAGATGKEVQAVESQIKQMEQVDGERLNEAFEGEDYKSISFDNYIGTIDGKLDGNFDAVKKFGSDKDSDVEAKRFCEVVTFNKDKLESRVCQYFYSNVFREKASSIFTLTLESDLKEHLEYCVYALNIAKNYASEIENEKNPVLRSQMMERKEIFEKMGQRGLELVSRGRKKPYIEFDEDGNPTINEENIARRYCKIDKDMKFTSTQSVLSQIYKNGMTLYPSRKLDEYYEHQDKLISLEGFKGIGDEAIFSQIVCKNINVNAKEKTQVDVLKFLQVGKLNYQKVKTCLRDRGFNSTMAICAKRALASMNLRNEKSFGRQVIGKILKSIVDKQDRIEAGETPKKSKSQAKAVETENARTEEKTLQQSSAFEECHLDGGGVYKPKESTKESAGDPTKAVDSSYREDPDERV